MERFRGCDPEVLREVVKSSGVSFHENKRSWIFTCPRCDGRKKLFIQKSDGRFVCWKCKETAGYQGRPEYALADLLGQSVREVVARLYGGAGVSVSVHLDVSIADFFGDADAEEEIPEQLPTVSWPYNYYPIDHPRSARGAAYLAQRGVPVEVARLYGVRYCPEQRRVVFPVESHGELYGWQGRLVVPHQYVDERGDPQEGMKIESSKEIPRERVLMFSDRLDGLEHVVLCEGPVDAMKAHLCGGNVCTMGKAVSRGQMGLLLNHGVKRLYLALDPDAADEVQRLMREYYDDVEVYRMLARKGSEEKADLGAMTFEEVEGLFHRAERVGAGGLFVFLDEQHVVGSR